MRFDHLVWRARFTGAESDVIRRGLTPQSMDDKWIVSMERDTILFKRSWTGFLIYKVHVTPLEGGGFEVTGVEVCADESQYKRGSDAYERKFINWLIRELMLGQDVEMPMPDELKPTIRERIAGLAASIVGYFRESEAPDAPAAVVSGGERFMAIARAIVESRLSDKWIPEFEFRITDPDGDYFSTRRPWGKDLTVDLGPVFVFADTEEGVMLGEDFGIAPYTLAEIQRSPVLREALSAWDVTNPQHVEAMTRIVRNRLAMAGALGETAALAAKQPTTAPLPTAKPPTASPARERFLAMMPFHPLVWSFDELHDPEAAHYQFAWVDGSLRGRDAVLVTIWVSGSSVSIDTKVVRGLAQDRAGVLVHNRTRVMTPTEWRSIDILLQDAGFTTMPMDSKSGALDGSFWMLRSVRARHETVVVRISPRESSDAGFRRICSAMISMASVPDRSRRDILG